MATSCKNVGKNKLSPNSASKAHALNPEVWVLRKDKTKGRVKLLEGHKENQKKEYPKLAEEFRSFPANFEYKQNALKSIDGFPHEFKAGKSKLEKEWKETTMAQGAEEKVYNNLVTVFSNKPGGSMLWNDFETKNLFKVKSDALRKEYEEAMKQQPSALDLDLTEEEKSLNEIQIQSNFDDFNAEVEQLVEKLLGGKSSLSKSDFEVAFSVKDCQVFQNQLSDKQRKTIKDQMMKGFEKLKNMGREFMERDEMTFFFKRYLIALLKKNDEFDSIVLGRLDGLICHLETKSYPQTGKIDPKGLKKVIKEGDEQLGKGKTFFEDVILPLSGVSSPLTMVSLICMPNIPS